MLGKLVVLSALLLPATAGAQEGVLLWQGKIPSAHAFVPGVGGIQTVDCYPTLRQVGPRQFYHAFECPPPAEEMAAVGVPADGPIINMSNFHEATRAWQDPKTGRIKLY